MDRKKYLPDITEEDKKIIKLFKDEMNRINLLYLKAIHSNDITKANQLLKRIKSIAKTLNEKYWEWADVKIPTEYLKGTAYINNVTWIWATIYFWDKLSKSEIKSSLKSLWPVHIEAVNALLDNSKNYVRSSLDWMERQALTMLNELQQEQVREELAKWIISWEWTYNMNKRMEKYFIDNQITGFKDRWWKYWSMDRYIDMLTRTETSIANTQGTINRAIQLWITKFQIVEKPDCCEECAEMDWDIVDISKWTVELPPFHPNCRWFIIAVFEYPTTLSEQELDRILFSVKTGENEEYVIGNGITKDIWEIMDKLWYRKWMYKNVINTSWIQHLLDRHWIWAEKKRGQRPITFDDIKKIPSIVYNPDEVSYRWKSKNSLDVISLKKTIDWETYNYRMRINPKWKIVEPQSFFIKVKKGG